MSPAPRTRWLVRRAALIVLALYGLQVAVVTLAYVVPESTAVHAGSKYEIKRGWARGVDYLPLIGAGAVITGSPCRLIITDQTTGATQVERYDLASDAYDANPHVWPQKP